MHGKLSSNDACSTAFIKRLVITAATVFFAWMQHACLPEAPIVFPSQYFWQWILNMSFSVFLCGPKQSLLDMSSQMTKTYLG